MLVYYMTLTKAFRIIWDTDNKLLSPDILCQISLFSEKCLFVCVQISIQSILALAVGPTKRNTDARMHFPDSLVANYLIVMTQFDVCS